jgi:excinuclease ABC subunit C
LKRGSKFSSAGVRDPRVRDPRVRDPLAGKLSSVPKRPGVYIFKGPKEKVLYVGKGKDLKARLGSYFRKSAALDARKSSMVRGVRDFSYIVTGNELEALALEANLIKQYRPRFNVILRDDKNYPYLRLTLNEEWPRLEVVRKVKRDGAMYFGPYVPAGAMWEALSVIRRHFGIRPCRYRLERPMRPCIQLEMGRCPAPCAGLVGREEYMRAVDEVVLFLRGRNTELLDELEARMRRASDELRYEEAALLRDRIAALGRAFESQKVISPELGDIDVIGCHACGGEGGEAAFQVFFIKSGVMIGSKDFYIRDVGGLQAGELMHGFLEMFYAKEIVPPAEVVVGTRPEGVGNLAAWLRGKRGGRVRIFVPREKKRVELLRMAEENARLMFEARGGAGAAGALLEIQRRLALPEVPGSIGAFDVSNISGGEAVGAFVYWAGGAFQKDRYRRIKIKTVTGVDDYAMMRETVGRVLKEEEVMPDLVVVDGGRGHLEVALKALGGLGPGKPMVASIAKDPDRVFVPYVEEPVSVEDRGASSLLMRRIRDEVHRFAISLHKKLRGRRFMESPLEKVPGVARKRRLALLRHFGSLEAIRRAGVDELAGVPGMDRRAAESVRKALGEEGTD